MDLPDRLTPGKPPLRVSEFATLAGVAPATVGKWLKAGAVSCVALPVSGERRIPVSAAVDLLRSLRVLA